MFLATKILSINFTLTQRTSTMKMLLQLCTVAQQKAAFGCQSYVKYWCWIRGRVRCDWMERGWSRWSNEEEEKCDERPLRVNQHGDRYFMTIAATLHLPHFVTATCNETKNRSMKRNALMFQNWSHPFGNASHRRLVRSIISDKRWFRIR